MLLSAPLDARLPLLGLLGAVCLICWSSARLARLAKWKIGRRNGASAALADTASRPRGLLDADDEEEEAEVEAAGRGSGLAMTASMMNMGKAMANTPLAMSRGNSTPSSAAGQPKPAKYDQRRSKKSSLVSSRQPCRALTSTTSTTERRNKQSASCAGGGLYRCIQQQTIYVLQCCRCQASRLRRRAVVLLVWIVCKSVSVSVCEYARLPCTREDNEEKRHGKERGG